MASQKMERYAAIRGESMKTIKTSKVIWGIAGSLLVLIISQILAQLLASLFAVINIPIFICNAAAGILYAVFAYFLLKLYAEKILRMELSDLGIPKPGLKTKWIIIALILPLSITGIYFLLPGDLQKSGMDLPEAIATVCAGLFFTGLAAGIVEEMVFRGFIMNLLDKKIGRKAAIIIPSLLFGLVHIIGMDFSLLSCLQVLVAGTFVGIMFSFIALEQRSIWNSAIVHALWNIVILGGFLSIGESIDQYSVFTYVLKTGSFAITGGDFGIESSVIAICGYIAVAFIAYMGASTSHRKMPAS